MFFSDFCVNLLIHPFLKIYLGKCHLDGNRLVRELLRYIKDWV